MSLSIKLWARLASGTKYEVRSTYLVISRLPSASASTPQLQHLDFAFSLVRVHLQAPRKVLSDVKPGPPRSTPTSDDQLGLLRHCTFCIADISIQSNFQLGNTTFAECVLHLAEKDQPPEKVPDQDHVFRF